MDKQWARRAKRKYTAAQYGACFLVFSAMGWMWEFLLRLTEDGVFVNPGTMHGPWLPSYGVGGVLAVILLRRLAHRPFLVFAAGTVLCGGIEYTAGRFLLTVYGLRWWDYSAWPLHVDGLVCLPVSLAFGLGCCAALYVLAPAVAGLLDCLPRPPVRWCCVLLGAMFAVDIGWSAAQPNTGMGVSDYGSAYTAQTADGQTVIDVARAAFLPLTPDGQMLK